MLVLNTKDADFEKDFNRMLHKILEIHPNVQRVVEQVFRNIARYGDRSLFTYTRRFDSNRLTSRTVRVTKSELEHARSRVPNQDEKTLKLAARRIKSFHRHQGLKGFAVREKAGATLAQRVLPLGRIGICIPAGTAPLASTVLMTAIPARLAGVKEIAMISPWRGGETSPHILAAAAIAGVDEIYKVGGAQGVAALALGTHSIRPVEKIAGPGSIWVNAAKLFAFLRGLVDIDMLAGPSEIVVVADGSVDVAFAAADLLSQAEHGRDSIAILITTKRHYAEDLISELRRQARSLARMTDVQVSFMRNIRVIVCAGLEEAARLVDRIAPEHLEIHTSGPEDFLKRVNNAASVFLGGYSPVALGDYLAGPNHVLPTAGRARFASPLGVHDFQKTQSVTSFSRQALEKVAAHAERFALLEGLDAHARAVALRKEKKRKK